MKLDQRHEPGDNPGTPVRLRDMDVLNEVRKLNPVDCVNLVSEALKDNRLAWSRSHHALNKGEYVVYFDGIANWSECRLAIRGDYEACDVENIHLWRYKAVFKESDHLQVDLNLSKELLHALVESIKEAASLQD